MAVFACVVLGTALASAGAQGTTPAGDTATASRVRSEFRTVPRALITESVDRAHRVATLGAVHQDLAYTHDMGKAPSSLVLEHIHLVLRRPAERQAAFDGIIDALHTPGNPSYQHWLQAADIAAEFGLAPSDIATITTFLREEGFTVNRVGGNGTYLDFSGTAAQVESSFATSIHNVRTADGATHYAAVSPASLPAALSTAVLGFVSLSDLPAHKNIAPLMPSVVSAQTPIQAAKTVISHPNYTSGSFYYMGPQDFYTIYNEGNLISAGNVGNGQTVALLEQTDITPADVTSFRTTFNILPNTANLTVAHGSASVACTDPGKTADEDEAILDTEWAGAVAPSATLLFMSCANGSTGGIFLSAEAVIDNNLAPVMSLSYGAPETGNQAFQGFVSGLWEQAAAQGQTVVVSAGDSGAAGASDQGTGMPATHGIVANLFGDSAYNVSAGGTDFQDLYNQYLNDTAYGTATYWNSTNGTGDSSAKSYIAETVWNSSCASSILANLEGYASPNAYCDTGNFASAAGGGGGVSIFAPRPSWQAANSVYGIPAATGTLNYRLMPDVSLFASNGLYGHAMPYFQSDTSSSLQYAGGTSFVAPQLAAVFAVIVQKTGHLLGQPNYVLYSAGAAAYGTTSYITGCNGSGATGIGTTSSVPASTCNFQDIATSSNAVPCTTGDANCYSDGNATYGVLSTGNSASTLAYPAGLGYDMATGLGSLNIGNLVNHWATLAAGSGGSAGMSVSATSASYVYGNPASITYSAFVSATGTFPTGSVAFSGSSSIGAIGSSALVESSTCASGGTCQETATVNYTPAATLTTGSYTVTGTYTSTDGYAATTGATALAVTTQTPTLTAQNVTAATSPATLTATLAYTGTGASPSGAVTFQVDSGSVVTGSCSPATNQLNCSASYPLTGLAPGSHTITVVNAADANYAGTTKTATLNDTQSSQTITFPQPATPAATGSSATLTATSTSSLAVTYAISASSTGTATISGSMVTYTGAGSVIITASQAGNATYAAAAPVSDTVNVTMAPTLTLKASPDPAAAGTSVTLTATLSASSVSGESVTFKYGATVLGTGTLSNGIATYTTSTLPTGIDSLTAVYAGDSTYPGATSNTFNTVIGSIPGFIVTSNLDDGTGACTNQNASGATADAKCELRAALAAVPNVSGAVQPTVTFAAALTGKTITLTSGLSSANNVALNGPGVSNLTIAGPNTGTSLLSLTGASTNVTVSGLAFKTGAYGIYASGSGMSLLVNASSFTGFVQPTVYGTINGGLLTVNNSLVTNNSGSSNIGQGVSIYNSSLSLNGDTFTNNTGTNGGAAVYFYGSATGQSVNIANSTFTGNLQSTGGSGAAIYAYETSEPLTITNSLFANNGSVNGNSYPSGGAINVSVSAMTISNSTFTGNYIHGGTNGSAGAIYANGSPLLFYNDTITGNFVVGTNDTQTGSSVSGSSSSSSGGVRANNAAYYNTYVGGNGADTSPDANSGTSTNSFVGIGGSGASQYNYGFTTLGNYGGPTSTLLPLPRSPLIQAGSTASTGGATTDQRGYARVSSGVDIGAVQTAYTVNFVQQPTNTPMGASITPAPTAQIYERSLAVPASGAIVSLTASAGTLAGTASQAANSAGLVTFPGLSITPTESTELLVADLFLTPGGSFQTAQTSNSFVVTGTATQTITFSQPASPAIVGTTATLSATSTSGLPVTFTITSGSATLNGNQITYSATGPVVIAASQGGNATYAPASTVSNTVQVQNQSVITWSPSSNTGYKGVAVGPGVLDATSTTPGAFAYTATLSGGSPVAITATSTLAVGSYTLTASFTPADTTNNTSATATIPFTVSQQEVFVSNSGGTVTSLYDNGILQKSKVSGGGIGAAVDPAGFVFSLYANGNGLYEYADDGTQYNFYNGYGATAATALAVDGSGLVYFTNGNGTIDALNKITGTVFAVPVAAAAGITSPTAISIDSSGSLWIASSGDNSAVEIIGAAAPVVTPTVNAVKNSNPGTRP